MTFNTVHELTATLMQYPGQLIGLHGEELQDVAVDIATEVNDYLTEATGDSTTEYYYQIDYFDNYYVAQRLSVAALNLIQQQGIVNVIHAVEAMYDTIADLLPGGQLYPEQ